MGARKHTGKQQRRHGERDYLQRESGSTGAIIFLTLVIIAGAGVGLSIGFGFSLLIGLLLAGMVQIIKRLCLMPSPDYDRSTEAEPLRWVGYFLCAAVTGLGAAYGAYWLTGYIHDSAATSGISRPAPDVKPRGELAPAVPSFADRDWQELINRVRSVIEAGKVRVSRMEDSDPRKEELSMRIFDAGRSLLRVDIALGELMGLTQHLPFADPANVPGGGKLDWQSNLVEPDWLAPVRELKAFVGQLEARVRLLEDSNPAKSRLLGQIDVVTSWLTDLEAHLNRFTEPYTAPRGMAFSLLPGQGLAPELTPANENGTSGAVAPPPTGSSFVPIGFVNFLEAAKNGDPLAFSLLIAAAILEAWLYFKVKQKQHREHRDW